MAEETEKQVIPLPEAAPVVKSTAKKGKNGGIRAGQGRPKGSYGPKMRGLLAAEAAMAKSTPRAGKAPVKARAGIEPLDLMLEEMRASWIEAHKAWSVADKLAKEADKLPQGKEQDAKREEARNLKLAAEGHANRARELASAAAPYRHPKLANQTATLAGGLTIEIRRFSGADK